ncbi:MAG: hypothetical protein H7Z41_03860, partial [Cytophagales bacterium]|nr:hypothetical protein [Armatimonadota bacterium]
SPGANFESFIQEMSRIVAQAGNRVVTPETAPALFAQVLPLFARYRLEPILPGHGK